MIEMLRSDAIALIERDIDVNDSNAEKIRQLQEFETNPNKLIEYAVSLHRIEASNFAYKSCLRRIYQLED